MADLLVGVQGRGKKGVYRSLCVWLCGYVVWLCGYVALGLCGYGYVALCLCGYVAWCFECALRDCLCIACCLRRLYVCSIAWFPLRPWKQ